MKPLSVISISVAGSLLVGLLAISPASAAPRGTIAEESVSGAQLFLAPTVGFERATLTLHGPRELRIAREFGPGESIGLPLVDESGAPLPDGLYRYGLRISPRPEGGSAFQTGVFYIQDGSAVSRQSKRTELAGIREELNEKRALVTGPPAVTNADDILNLKDTAKDGRTRFSIYSYTGGDSSAWDIRNDFRELSFNRFSHPGSPDPNPVLFLSDNINYVGIGTETPYGSLMIVSDASPEVYLSDPDAGYFVEIEMGSYAGGLSIRQNFTTNFYLDAAEGNLGLGTTNPQADLEIYDPGSFAAFRLNNAIASWAVSNTNTGVISFNKIGSGGQEMTVRPRLDAAGPTMEVQGTVSATNFSLISSREQKTDFKSLDSSQVLSRLNQLPIQSWRYKHEAEGVQHVGPVAEDFHELFQIGDDQHLSAVDVTGVMMAAIQELSKENAQLRAAYSEEIAALRERLAALESQGR